MDKKKIILLIINLFIFISTLIITILGIIFGAGDAQNGSSIIGIRYFIPYTMDSNILMGIFAGIFSIYLILNIFKQKEIPNTVNLMYFIGTLSVTLTFLMVLFFLAPTSAINANSNKALAFFTNFSSDLFFFHFLNPILAITSYFLMSKKNYTYKENLIGLIPLFIYSIVYTLNVAVFKNWSDFYGFTFGGKMYLIPIVLIVIYLATYLIGFILIKIKNKIDLNHSKKMNGFKFYK